MGGRASRQEADRHTLSERATETQNEGRIYRREIQMEAEERSRGTQRDTHRDTHLEIETERPRDRERLTPQVRDGRTRCHTGGTKTEKRSKDRKT